jgi:hypothetical protein
LRNELTEKNIRQKSPALAGLFLFSNSIVPLLHSRARVIFLRPRSFTRCSLLQRQCCAQTRDAQHVLLREIQVLLRGVQKDFRGLPATAARELP